MMIALFATRAVHRQHLAAGLGAARAWPSACGCSWRPRRRGRARRSCSGSGWSRRSRPRRRPTSPTTSRRRARPTGWRGRRRGVRLQGRPHRRHSWRTTPAPSATSGSGTRDHAGQLSPSCRSIQSFYAINDVDVDRYKIDGEPTQVMLSARDLDTVGHPAGRRGRPRHLTYTHGYGVVLAPANAKDRQRRARPAGRGHPGHVRAATLPKVDAARDLLRREQAGYVIVNTEREEIDYQDEARQDRPPATRATTASRSARAPRVRPQGGVRAALRRHQPADLGEHQARLARCSLERDVTARLKAVAPFLAYDHDPYVVVLDGQRPVRASTATRPRRNYPNAQRADTGGLDPASGPRTAARSTTCATR